MYRFKSKKRAHCANTILCPKSHFWVNVNKQLVKIIQTAEKCKQMARIGKQTAEIGKQTAEKCKQIAGICKQTTEIGKQTADIRKQICSWN